MASPESTPTMPEAAGPTLSSPSSSESLPSFLISDNSSVTSSLSSFSNSPVARKPPPDLRISDHWGVAEVLDYYSEKSPTPSLGSASAIKPMQCKDERPNETVVKMLTDISSKPKKSSDRRDRRKARRTKQVEVLKVDAKLAAGLESLGW